MRLYLTGTSKKGIGYIPDVLTVVGHGRRLVYDVQGDIDYNPTDLDCQVKGELLLIDKEGELKELTNKQIKQLVEMLKDDSYEKIIQLYPQSLADDCDDISDDDVVTDCECHFLIFDGKEEQDVTFHPQIEILF